MSQATIDGAGRLRTWANVNAITTRTSYEGISGSLPIRMGKGGNGGDSDDVEPSSVEFDIVQRGGVHNHSSSFVDTLDLIRITRTRVGYTCPPTLADLKSGSQHGSDGVTPAATAAGSPLSSRSESVAASARTPVYHFQLQRLEPTVENEIGAEHDTFAGASAMVVLPEPIRGIAAQGHGAAALDGSTSANAAAEARKAAAEAAAVGSRGVLYFGGYKSDIAVHNRAEYLEVEGRVWRWLRVRVRMHCPPNTRTSHMHVPKQQEHPAAACNHCALQSICLTLSRGVWRG